MTVFSKKCMTSLSYMRMLLFINWRTDKHQHHKIMTRNLQTENWNAHTLWIFMCVPVEDMPVGAPMLMYSGAGAASVVVPLVLIGLALLILTRSKRRGETYCNDDVQSDACTHSMLGTQITSLILSSDLCRNRNHLRYAIMGRERESSIWVLII